MSLDEICDKAIDEIWMPPFVTVSMLKRNPSLINPMAMTEDILKGRPIQARPLSWEMNFGDGTAAIV